MFCHISVYHVQHDHLSLGSCETRRSVRAQTQNTKGRRAWDYRSIVELAAQAGWPYDNMFCQTVLFLQSRVHVFDRSSRIEAKTAQSIEALEPFRKVRHQREMRFF